MQRQGVRRSRFQFDAGPNTALRRNDGQVRHFLHDGAYIRPLHTSPPFYNLNLMRRLCEYNNAERRPYWFLVVVKTWCAIYVQNRALFLSIQLSRVFFEPTSEGQYLQWSWWRSFVVYFNPFWALENKKNWNQLAKQQTTTILIHSHGASSPNSNWSGTERELGHDQLCSTVPARGDRRIFPL